jgi:hypothetical protein
VGEPKSSKRISIVKNTLIFILHSPLFKGEDPCIRVNFDWTKI